MNIVEYVTRTFFYKYKLVSYHVFYSYYFLKDSKNLVEKFLMLGTKYFYFSKELILKNGDILSF